MQLEEVCNRKSMCNWRINVQLENQCAMCNWRINVRESMRNWRINVCNVQLENQCAIGESMCNWRIDVQLENQCATGESVQSENQLDIKTFVAAQIAWPQINIHTYFCAINPSPLNWIPWSDLIQNGRKSLLWPSLGQDSGVYEQHNKDIKYERHWTLFDDS